MVYIGIHHGYINQAEYLYEDQNDNLLSVGCIICFGGYLSRALYMSANHELYSPSRVYNIPAVNYLEVGGRVD